MTLAFDVIKKFLQLLHSQPIFVIASDTTNCWSLLLESDVVWHHIVMDKKGKFWYYGWLHVRRWWLRRLWWQSTSLLHFDDDFAFDFTVELWERKHWKLQVIRVHAVEIMIRAVVTPKKIWTFFTSMNWFFRIFFMACSLPISTL